MEKKKSWQNLAHQTYLKYFWSHVLLGHLKQRAARLSQAQCPFVHDESKAECDVAGRLLADFVRLIRGGRCRQNTDAYVRESKRGF